MALVIACRQQTSPPVTTELAVPGTAGFRTPPADAASTPGGVPYQRIKDGNAPTPARKPTSLVKFYYSAWTPDGHLVEEVTTGRPAHYAFDSMIAGWREAISVMREGEKDRFWISEDMRRGGGWAERGTLVFDIELVEVWE